MLDWTYFLVFQDEFYRLANICTVLEQDILTSLPVQNLNLRFCQPAPLAFNFELSLSPAYLYENYLKHFESVLQLVEIVPVRPGVVAHEAVKHPPLRRIEVHGSNRQEQT